MATAILSAIASNNGEWPPPSGAVTCSNVKVETCTPLAWPAPTSSCEASDAQLLLLEQTVCASIGGCPAGNTSGRGDWPNQAVYMGALLTALVAPTTCLNTSQARKTVGWLDSTTPPTKSPWWDTWVLFQVQYYDMPRKPGSRIESPATLGRKCWAFAYLGQIWNPIKPVLERAAADSGLTIKSLVTAYDSAVAETMGLCHKVMANCFVNSSYDPQRRNGTCPDVIGKFFVGFQWENGLRENVVAYPFPSYNQPEADRRAVTFAVNTAISEII